MTSLPWCRLYTEFASDPKIQILAFEDQRHYVMLLCLKGNGTLDATAPSEAYRERLIAKALGLDPNAAGEAKRRLIEGGLIDNGWHPVKWESRQHKSDHDAAERKRNQRIRDRQRDSHDNVTTMSRDSHALEESRGDKKKTVRGASHPRTVKASKCPPDFVPDLSLTLAKLPDLDFEAELTKFRDWEFKTPRSDWAAVWRTWIQNAKERGQYAKKQTTNGAMQWARVS